MNCTVVGFFTAGRNVAPAELRNDTQGLTFEPEPLNAFDPNAVKLIMSGVHVAYVSREDALAVKAFLALHNNRYTVSVNNTFGASALLELHHLSAAAFEPNWPID